MEVEEAVDEEGVVVEEGGTSGGRLDVLTDQRLTSNPLHPIFIDLLQQAQVARLAANFRDEELNTVFHQVTGPIWLGEKEPNDAFFKEFNDAAWTTTVMGPRFIGEATRVRIANFVMTHTMDIYGQMVVYLRLNGIVPPASRREN